MKALLPVLTAAVLVSTAWAPHANAGGPFDITENYYTDASFTTAVGWTEQFCDDTYDYDGTFTNYRYVERTNCTNHNVVDYCEVWNSTTNTWESVECPSPAADGRLHIPIG
jgi:glucose dehydrogenase